MAVSAIESPITTPSVDTTPAVKSSPATTTWDAPLKQRLQCITRFRRSLADDPKPFVEALNDLPWRSREAESLAAEVLPLLDAARFLERKATSLLKPRRLGWRGRPLWLMGVRVETRREPWGGVLIIAPSNYPLMLPGIQMLQALAAGNRVMVKPSPASLACSNVMWLMISKLVETGVPKDIVELLDSDPAAVTEKLQHGEVDKVVLTGSLETGRAVMRDLAGASTSSAARPTPAVMELSGCDAMFVLAGADEQRVVDALRFGLTFNQSATCIAPRRIFVDPNIDAKLRPEVQAMVNALPAVEVNRKLAEHCRQLRQDALDRGTTVIGGEIEMKPGDESASMRPMLIVDPTGQTAMFQGCDVFAPVMAWRTFSDVESALKHNKACSYRLGASVFGSSDIAASFAKRLNVGTVTINDLIAPTADPRITFGGSGDSGFGSTRGPEGLLDLTRPCVVLERRGGMTVHLDEPDPSDTQAMQALIRLTHGSTWRQRWQALRSLLAVNRQKNKHPMPNIDSEPEGSTGTTS